MSDDDTVSVKALITTYNRCEWARDAIESALSQTHPSVHLVLVDDASDDGTAEVLSEYAERYPDRITTILKDTNRGVADSVRRGLRAAPATDYVALLNDDDKWYPTFVERAVGVLRERPELTLVFAECDVVDEQLTPTGRVFSDLVGRFRAGDFHDVLRGNHASASTLVFTSEIADRAADTLPDRLVVFDYYIMLLAAGYGAIAGIDEPLAIYRETSDGLHTGTSRAWRDTTVARLSLFEDNSELVERIGGHRAARREVALRTLDLAMLQWSKGNVHEYLWHSAWIVRLRQLRVLVWLALHTAGRLFNGPGELGEN